MKRSDARIEWEALYIEPSALSRSQLQNLRLMVNAEMRKSDLIDGSFECFQRFKTGGDWPLFWASLRCRSRYFENRECITFNDDGFIGFAGWADDVNIQPILTAFCAWVGKMKVAKAA